MGKRERENEERERQQREREEWKKRKREEQRMRRERMRRERQRENTRQTRQNLHILSPLLIFPLISETCLSTKAHWQQGKQHANMQTDIQT